MHLVSGGQTTLCSAKLRPDWDDGRQSMQRRSTTMTGDYSERRQGVSATGAMPFGLPDLIQKLTAAAASHVVPRTSAAVPMARGSRRQMTPCDLRRLRRSV